MQGSIFTAFSDMIIDKMGDGKFECIRFYLLLKINNHHSILVVIILLEVGHCDLLLTEIYIIKIRRYCGVVLQPESLAKLKT